MTWCQALQWRDTLDQHITAWHLNLRSLRCVDAHVGARACPLLAIAGTDNPISITKAAVLLAIAAPTTALAEAP